MNDDFLYELRNNPPAEFATRLKAQLERQTVEAQRRQRAFRWAAIAAMLVGSTAIAFVSPTVRQATLTMIVQLRGGEPAAPLDPQLQRLIEQKDARASQRIMPDVPFEQDQLPEQMEWSAASGREAPDAATFAARPDGGGVAGSPEARESATSIGGARGRSLLRIGHTRDSSSAAERIAAALERGYANVDTQLTALPVHPGACVRGGSAAAVDVWVDDWTVADSGDPCANGRRFVKVPLAFDAIVVVAHRENSWARTIGMGDLRKLRDRGANDPPQMWSQLRAEWPTLPLALAGTSLRDSELGRRFANGIGLNMDVPPSTFVLTKDDRATLRYVESTLGAIGFIDYATWFSLLSERSATPTVVAITNEKGEAVEPVAAAIQERRYPLSRPLWLFVEANRGRRNEIYTAVNRLAQSRTLEESGLIPLGRDEQRDATRLLRGF